MNYQVISFYRYVTLDNPEFIKNYLRQNCQKLEILGRILIGQEGINGAVCGEKQSMVEFKKYLKILFPALTYREQDCEEQAYHKLVVRVREEIVAFGKNVSFENTGKHLSPQDLDQWYRQKKDFVIIDARNTPETEVGKFQGAVTLPIRSFRQFPDAIKILDSLKEKKVVMYCTGGIRCEKASAYMKEQGFQDVYQLDGGIIQYVNQFPQGFYEGACFVFDDRLTSYVDRPISVCALCGVACAEFTNCYNLDCDTLFVCCRTCREEMKNTCSRECMHSSRQRKIQEKKEVLPVLGVVENYYPRVKVALVKLEGDLCVESSVSFFGHTTKDVQEKIVVLKDYEGNILEKAQRGMRVTFPVKEKVRVHDTMILLEEA